MDATEARTDGAGKIAPEVVRNHLRLVLAHGEFADSPQLAAFLAYVVERKLEGAEDRIKAYAIATEALGRPSSFDAQNDPIVRVQAKRLRQALQLYYSDPHADDAIRITLPVGGYVPEIKAFDLSKRAGEKPLVQAPRFGSRLTFASLGIAVVAMVVALWSSFPALREGWAQLTWRQPEALANPLGMPAMNVRVASVRQIPGWFSAESFDRGLELNLSRFDEFVVFSSDEETAARQAAFRLDLEFTGNVSTVVGSARLMRTQSGQILWSNRFTIPEDSIASYELIEPVRRLSSTLGQPYGVLYSQLLADPQRTPDQSCLLRGYEWFQKPGKGEIEPIRLCLEDLLKRNAGNHIAHILLGYLYVARYRNGLSRNADADLAHALTMAKRAIALRPESAGSQQVMMEVQSALGHADLALEAGKKAVALNPNDSDVLADFGCRLIYRGRYSEGSTYAERAARWNPQRPPWHEFCLFLAANNQGHYVDAELIAQRLDGEEGPEAYVPVAIAAWRRGDHRRAARAIADLVAYDPSYAVDPQKALGLIGLFADVSKTISGELMQAGLTLRQ